jgi:transposase
MEKLKPKQIKALDLMVNEGMTYTDVARTLKMSRATIYNWFADNTFLDEYNKQIKQRQTVLAIESLNGITEMARNAESESVKLNALIRISDMSGYKPTDKIENTGAAPTYNFQIVPVGKEDK